MDERDLVWCVPESRMHSFPACDAGLSAGLEEPFSLWHASDPVFGPQLPTVDDVEMARADALEAFRVGGEDAVRAFDAYARTEAWHLKERVHG